MYIRCTFICAIIVYKQYMYIRYMFNQCFSYTYKYKTYTRYMCTNCLSPATT